MIENHRAMLRNEGPFFDHWRRRMLASFGVIVSPEPEPERGEALASREQAA